MLENHSFLLGNCTSFCRLHCRAQGHHQVLNLHQEGRGISLGVGEEEDNNKKPSKEMPKLGYFLLPSGRLVR